MRIDYVPVASIRGRTVFFPDWPIVPHVGKRNGIILSGIGILLVILAIWPETRKESR